MLAFLDAEANALGRHARMISERLGHNDKAVHLCLRRESVFVAAAALIRGAMPPPLYDVPDRLKTPDYAWAYR